MTSRDTLAGHTRRTHSRRHYIGRFNFDYNHEYEYKCVRNFGKNLLKKLLNMLLKICHFFSKKLFDF